MINHLTKAVWLQNGTKDITAQADPEKEDRIPLTRLLQLIPFGRFRSTTSF